MDRRQVLKTSLGGVGLLLGTGTIAKAFDAACGIVTPAQPEGPFYAMKDKYDQDSDLTFVSRRWEKADGEVIYIKGRILDENCMPVEGALVEIWQACTTGRYNHPNDTNPAKLDRNFQYWGKTISDREGVYNFKTIIPGAYPADTDWIRPPHVHYRIVKLGYKELITQMYFDGNQYNANDKILQSLSKTDQESVVIKLENGVATFDIILKKP